MLAAMPTHAQGGDHMSDKLTTKQAIEHVLNGKRKMRVPAIIEAAVPLTGLSGKTPGQTIYSALYSESKQADGRFVQVGKGEFKLAPKRVRKAA
jgi:hypothetical protein